MNESKIKTCPFCREHEEDGEGCIYPYYGLAPHTHKKGVLGSTEFTGGIPLNFDPDPDCNGMGTYTHCLYCGSNGSVEGANLEKEEN